MASDSMVVQLYHQETGTIITSVVVRDGNPACLTGAIDLPEGDNTICVRMYPASWEGSGSYDGASVQIIVGQTVDSQGCTPTGAGGCGPT